MQDNPHEEVITNGTNGNADNGDNDSDSQIELDVDISNVTEKFGQN